MAFKHTWDTRELYFQATEYDAFFGKDIMELALDRFEREPFNPDKEAELKEKQAWYRKVWAEFEEMMQDAHTLDDA